MRTSTALLILASALACSAPAGAPAPQGAAAKNASPAAPRPAETAGPRAAEPVASLQGISEYRLANGLRVLIFPDPSKSTLTVNVTYFVGSRHEGYGEAGMAHLLEHMMFKGTPTHGEVLGLLQKRGAEANGTTSYDRTNYFETLPATDENLEFALDLEADRMVNSKIAAEDLATEFSVVRNEFELGESNPASVLQQRMLETAYLWHNYGKPTIGNRSDIERVPADRLRAFYQRFYQPDNAMLVIAGRFDPAQALALVDRHFGPLPRPARVLDATYTVEPPQDGERSVVLRRSGSVALVGVAYHGVAGADEDYLPLDAALHVLTDESTGRLYKSLVKTGMANRVWGYAYGLAEPGTAMVFAEVDAKKPLEPVRDRLIQAVENFSRPSAEEVSRYVNRSKKEAELALTHSDEIAVELSEYAAMGDWRLFFVILGRLDGLTPELVESAAHRYLQPSNRTVGMFVPTDRAVRTALRPAPDVTALVSAYRDPSATRQGEAFEASAANIERRTERFQLESGMKVALLPKQTRGDAVQATLIIPYGSEAEFRGKTSSAEMLAAMLPRGTRKLSYAQLRDALDALRAEVEIMPGNQLGFATVKITTVGEKLPGVLDLVADMLMQPSLPASELEVVRRETLSAYESQMGDPTAQGFNAALRAVTPFDPNDVRYTPTTAESIARIRAVKLADVQQLYRQLFGGSAAELAIVGDFDVPAVKKVLDSRYAKWRSPRPFQRIATQYREVVPVSRTIDTPDKEGAFVVAALPVKLRDDAPDYPALELASYILGGAANSRLFARLREKEGWSYGAFAGMQVDSIDELGYLYAGAMAAPQNAPKAEGGIVEEIERLLTDGITSAELAEAKKGYTEQDLRQLSDDSAVADRLAGGLYLNRTLAFREDLLHKVAALTPEQVEAALRRHVATARLSRILAGDLKKAGVQQ